MASVAAEVYPSEERTEPYTAEELSRLHRSIHVEDFDEAHHDTVPLDNLVVNEDHHRQGIRILVRPLTRSRSVSPGNDNCQWLALRAEVADPQQPEVKVLAVTQTSRDINFTIRIPGEHGDDDVRPPVWCELYYNPTSDGLILVNKSDDPITLARISHLPGVPGANPVQHMAPGLFQELLPGTWRIGVSGTPVLDFRILKKRPAVLRISSDSPDPSVVGSNDVLNSSMKRSLSPDGDDSLDDSSAKKLRMETEEEKKKDGVIIFLGPKDESLVFPFPNAARTKEVAIPNGHTLLEMFQEDETAMIPGGCEIDQYQLTKRSQIAGTVASSVFKAEHSGVPEGLITVKVLKMQATKSGTRAPHQEVIRQADVWLREYQSQEDLQHESIVRLYGGDARYLSLYMEHVDGKDLAARGVWRDDRTDMFRGSREDARRILRDIASALSYVHGKRKTHNDIKPANILYSRDRGAVLCDFGLSTRFTDPATTGGTPYYVPPEYIGHRSRTSASDVWALGVTMLYVLRRISFPDARGRAGHPRQLYWQIADLHAKPSHHQRRHANRGGASSAVAHMQQWLGEVAEAKARLDPNDKLESLVSQMLIPHPGQRITMAWVISELFPESDAAEK